MTSYAEFLERKAQVGGDHGFEPESLPTHLYDFQRDLVMWALRKGRGAIFADCGLGKTPMQLAWADEVVRHTGRAVLVLTPLAVSHQTLREAEKFEVEAQRARPGATRPLVYVTNYERLHHLAWSDFAGVVCDESSILKAFDGKRRAEITAFMRKLPHRLLCTATAAPNDYHELGTSSEALGYLGYTDMLGRFFKNDQQNIATGRQWGMGSKWRFKGHAAEPFWRWVCSWARALRRPSDLGYSDDRFALPPLEIHEHVCEYSEPLPGALFYTPPRTLAEQRAERRATIAARVDRVAALADHGDPVVCWCHLNAEADALVRAIPDAEQVAGSDADEVKEAKLHAFAEGRLRVLVTKPKIGAFGLNWQHCAHHCYFPSHSFEQWYQAVRRSWRFGQTRAVRVDVVTSTGEEGVLANLRRKADNADAMFDRLVEHMREGIRIDRQTYQPTVAPEVPTWLQQ